MADLSEASLSESSKDKDIFDLKQHVVQIEAMLTYVLICTAALTLAAQSGYRTLTWATAIISLAGISQVVRVRDPASRVRARTINVATGAASGAGTGLAIDTAFGGLTFGAAAAIGAVIGGVLGGLAPVPGEEKKKWLDWADTFKMLYEHRERCPTLANDLVIFTSYNSRSPRILR